MIRQFWTFTVVSAVVASSAVAGPYSGPSDTGHAIDPAIPSASPLFVEWADSIDASRTFFAPNGSSSISATGFNSLGDLDAAQIANGDSPGYLTVTFPNGIRNLPGHDFAVFENGFAFPSEPHLFAEFAFVEVSSNGTDFARFRAISTNTTWEGTFGQSFGGFDVTNVYNLAGKHAAGFGTPFDLDDLVNDPLVIGGLVKLDNVQYLRLVDIPGNGAYLDSENNPILDTWTSAAPTGGFDFSLAVGQGVGVIHAVPEPMSILLVAPALAAVILHRRRAG